MIYENIAKLHKHTHIHFLTQNKLKLKLNMKYIHIVLRRPANVHHVILFIVYTVFNFFQVKSISTR